MSSSELTKSRSKEKAELDSSTPSPTLLTLKKDDTVPPLGPDDELNLSAHAHAASDVDIPLKYRLIAFSMIIFFATGSSFAESTLSPLKSTLIKELKINNAQYGAIASASSLVNTILPIIGGIGMDHWGATYAAIISSIFILVGTIIASSSSIHNHFGLLIGGRILMGFGSTVIESTQNKLFAHWFKGSHLAFVFALDIAWSRIGTIYSRASAVPLSEINGFWGWALWVPTIVCAVNLGLVCLYWWFERTVPVQYRPALGKDAYNKEGWAKKKFGLQTVFRLPMFFWIFCGTQVLQNGAVNVYTSNLADIQTKTRGTSKLAAGYNSSLQGVIPIVPTPAAGYFFDRFGWRMIFVSWTAVIYVIVFSLIGFTKVHPLGPILLSSFALVTNALTFICAIPVLVGDDMLLGTAFGVWKSFQNCNSIIMDVSAGAIQDNTPGKSYDRVIYFIIVIKAVEILWGPVYDYLDGRWLGQSLRMPELKRVAYREQVLRDDIDVVGWRSDKRVSYAVMTQLTCMIIVAWVLYIVYAMGT